MTTVKKDVSTQRLPSKQVKDKLEGRQGGGSTASPPTKNRLLNAYNRAGVVERHPKTKASY